MMAAISNSSSSSSSVPTTALKSPRHGGGGAGDGVGVGVGSPQSRRAAARSPWTQIVRGESDPIAAVPSSPSAVAAVMEPAVAAAAASSFSSSAPSSSPPSASSSPSLVEETGGGENSEGGGSGPNGGNVGKRPAWNKPSNGGSVAEAGPVMGAVSWPALSEAARASSVKSSSESLKGLSDGLSSVPASQGSGTTVSTTTPSQKHAHPTSTPNHTGPARQRPMKRNNSNVSSNSGISQQQAPAGQVVEIASNNPSPKDHTQRSGFGSHAHGGGDHPQQRNSFRHRNGGPHPRGDGSHHHNYGGRRDQDRGSHDWNSHRSLNGRDNHMQQPRVNPRMFRGPTPPPSPNHYIPPHMRPFGAPPMGFPDLGPPMVYVAHPFVAPPLSPPVFFHAPDPQLPFKIVNQIDYYFSSENLIRDVYLRQSMDDQGWVPIKLIAGFNKVLHLTDNIQLILDSLRMSNVVEVQGDKVRRRNDWMRWLMPPPVQFPNVPSPRTPGKLSHDTLAARVQGIALEERSTNISSSGQGNYQPQLPNGDVVEHSFSGRN